MAGEEAVLRKWLIINGRYFEELKAMDRQCPWLLFIMVGVKVRTESGAVGGRHESVCPGRSLVGLGAKRRLFAESVRLWLLGPRRKDPGK